MKNQSAPCQGAKCPKGYKLNGNCTCTKVSDDSKLVKGAVKEISKEEYNKIRNFKNGGTMKKKMQSGGTSGGYPKSGGKMMKKGGIKKTLRKAQDGSEVGPYIPSDLPPKSKDKRTYSGPLTERDTKALNERYPSTVGKAAVMTGRGTKTNPISPKGVEAYYRRNDENYLRSGSPEVQKWNASPNAEGEFYPTTNKSDFKKGGAKKTSTMKKMKTGGMVNSNAKVQALKSAGSKGVKPGINPKATASKVAKGRSGGTSVVPKKAVPGKK